MTEKQIERIRTKITRVKRALADDKKRWGGSYDDSGGIRYMVPSLYLKIRDFKGAMNYFRWFDKNFPDDCCYGEFLLEWSLTLFMLGKVEDARQKIIDAYFGDTRVFNKFFGREVTMVDETIDSYERDWSAVQVLGYSAEEKDWEDFAIWLNNLLIYEPYLSLSKKFLDIQLQLQTEPDPAIRSNLMEMKNALKKNDNCKEAKLPESNHTERDGGNKKTNNIPTKDGSFNALVHSLEPMIKAIQKQQKQHLKLLEPIVREAIASKNIEVNDLSRLSDSLSEMVLFSGVGQELYHELLDYIETFDPGLAQWYRDNDKEMSGIYDDLIEEASHLAKEFHQTQKDKAGVDYFYGHLTYVGNAGYNWKEKIVGFLHDVAEDTPHTVEEIMSLLKEKSNGVLSNEDAQEIETALNLLNSSTASSRDEYITRIKESFLATKVKLNDLKHNMDISRIQNPTEKDQERLIRYKKEYKRILEYLGTE